MATSTYNQTDTALGTNTACILSDHCSTVGGTVEAGREVSQVALGSSEQTVSVAAGAADEAEWSWEIILVADTTMDNDDATIVMNFTTGDMDVTWESCFICHRDSSCNAITTLGSATGLAITSNLGQQQTVINCASATFTAGDVIIITCGFSEAGGHAAGTIGITPDQTMTLPWNPPAPSGKIMSSLAGGGGLASMGGIAGHCGGLAG